MIAAVVKNNLNAYTRYKLYESVDERQPICISIRHTFKEGIREKEKKIINFERRLVENTYDFFRLFFALKKKKTSYKIRE